MWKSKIYIFMININFNDVKFKIKRILFVRWFIINTEDFNNNFSLLNLSFNVLLYKNVELIYFTHLKKEKRTKKIYAMKYIMNS